jgi:hypothetical protein
MDDWVAEKGPVFATRDSIVIRKELDEVRNKSGSSWRDLLFGGICDLDERHVKRRLIEDGLSDCVHLDRLNVEKYGELVRLFGRYYLCCVMTQVSLLQLCNNGTIRRSSREKTRFEHRRIKTELMGVLKKIFIEKELTYEWEFMPRLAVLVSYQFIDDDHCGVAPYLWWKPKPRAPRLASSPSTFPNLRYGDLFSCHQPRHLMKVRKLTPSGYSNFEWEHPEAI